MNNIAIRVDGISKQYHIGGKQESYKALRDTLTDAFKAPFRRAGKLLRGQAYGAAGLDEIIWALKDVSFDIKQGEAVGIIGRNGAGKSTMLKILSRITEPTEGFAEVYGRVGSLLEVGTGFHPELTGRENIYLNGSILGLKRTEIGRKFDEMVAFAEVEKFIDTPVKHYSSGMYLRLAFAVAAHLEAEVLLVDEVLAVGDVAFQKKCLGKMNKVAKEGRTVIFVTHNMGAITQLCEKVLWFENGQLKLSGNSFDVVRAYLSSGTSGSSTWTNSSAQPIDEGIQVKSVRLLSVDNQLSCYVDFNKQFKVEIEYDVISATKNITIILRLTDMNGNIVWTSWDIDTTNWNGRVREPGRYLSTCKIPGHIFRPGSYYLSIGSLIPKMKSLSYHENVLVFDVSQVGYHLNSNRAGIITPLLEWEVKRIDGIY